jgi:hypothetical protein
VELKVNHKGNEYSVLLDDDDYVKIKDIGSIYISTAERKEYKFVRCNLYDKRKIRLARLLMNAPKNMEVDHINGNPLDNRRNNLRLATAGQNRAAFQSPRKNKTSRYRGVRWHKRVKKWMASIGSNHKVYYLGYYTIEEQAALAYNKAALGLFGEFAQLNVLTPSLPSDTIKEEGNSN